jgi:hypothetical protein
MEHGLWLASKVSQTKRRQAAHVHIVSKPLHKKRKGAVCTETRASAVVVTESLTPPRTAGVYLCQLVLNMCRYGVKKIGARHGMAPQGGVGSQQSRV